MLQAEERLRCVVGDNNLLKERISSLSGELQAAQEQASDGAACVVSLRTLVMDLKGELDSQLSTIAALTSQLHAASAPSQTKASELNSGVFQSCSHAEISEKTNSDEKVASPSIPSDAVGNKEIQVLEQVLSKYQIQLVTQLDKEGLLESRIRECENRLKCALEELTLLRQEPQDCKVKVEHGDTADDNDVHVAPTQSIDNGSSALGSNIFIRNEDVAYFSDDNEDDASFDGDSGSDASEEAGAKISKGPLVSNGADLKIGSASSDDLVDKAYFYWY